jgi:hypothetical protein
VSLHSGVVQIWDYKIGTQVAKFEVIKLIFRNMMDQLEQLIFIMLYLYLSQEVMMDLLKFGIINKENVCSL